jgi:hypothetical protein
MLKAAIGPEGQLVEIRQQPGVRRSLLAMFANVLSGLQQCEHETVFITEQDVLYPRDYFEYGPGIRPLTYAGRALFLLPNGFAKRINPAFSTCAGSRDFLIDGIYGKIMEHCERGKVRRSEIEPLIPRKTGTPTVDIRHGKNVTGMRVSSNTWNFDDDWGSADNWWSEMEVRNE